MTSGVCLRLRYRKASDTQGDSRACHAVEFVVPRSFLVEFLESLLYDMPPAISDPWTNLVPSVSKGFLLLLLWLCLPTQSWKGVRIMDSPVSVLRSLRLLQVFSSLRWCWCECLFHSFCYSEVCSLHPPPLGLLSWSHVRFCQKLFLRLLFLCPFCWNVPESQWWSHLYP